MTLTPKHVLWLLVPLGLGLLAVVFFFSPERHAFYPRCVFHSMTGLWCPGCGATRAVHALLHGHVARALHLNALIFLLAPLALGSLLAQRRGRRIPDGFGWILLAVVLLFGALRNVPVAPFTALAPETASGRR